jgi:hypothetical protein
MIKRRNLLIAIGALFGGIKSGEASVLSPEDVKTPSLDEQRCKIMETAVNELKKLGVDAAHIVFMQGRHTTSASWGKSYKDIEDLRAAQTSIWAQG